MTASTNSDYNNNYLRPIPPDTYFAKVSKNTTTSGEAQKPGSAKDTSFVSMANVMASQTNISGESLP